MYTLFPCITSLVGRGRLAVVLLCYIYLMVYSYDNTVVIPYRVGVEGAAAAIHRMIASALII
jgi:hypothetical protein